MSAILIPLAIIEFLVIIILLIGWGTARIKISELKKDNQKLLRRLQIISRSKIVD